MLTAVMKKFFNRSNSKEAAKKRLRFALVYDRLEVSDEILKNMQNEIVDVISRYFIIDMDQIKLDITRQDDLSALVLNTPIISAKSRPQPERTRKGKGAVRH